MAELRIVLIGATGRMGKAIVSLLQSERTKHARVLGGIVSEDDAYFNEVLPGVERLLMPPHRIRENRPVGAAGNRNAVEPLGRSKCVFERTIHRPHTGPAGEDEVSVTVRQLATGHYQDQ